MRCCREPFSGFSHLAGAVLAAVGLGVLVTLTWDQPGKMVSVLIYGLSLVTLYSASTALHLLKVPPPTLQRFSRIDHAAIYALIAGSYTPFCYNLLSGGWRWGLLAAVWFLAAGCMFYKLCFYTSKKSSVKGILFYVGIGSVGIVAAPQFMAILTPSAILLILAGGLLYTVGAIFYALDDPCCRPRYVNWHDVWHVFVLAASAVHFAAILFYVVQA